ncbi:MAG: hypothetical protein AAF670_13780 [Planctomycetota bacterium]
MPPISGVEGIAVYIECRDQKPPNLPTSSGESGAIVEIRKGDGLAEGDASSGETDCGVTAAFGFQLNRHIGNSDPSPAPSGT